MNYSIDDFHNFRKYSNLQRIGNQIKSNYVYKYLDIDGAKASLENSTLRFKAPNEWDDPYESRFYGAKYDLVEKEKFDKRLYACCVTKNPLSEAAWRMYTKDPQKHCVKFTICIGKLREYLNDFALKEKARLFEGAVKYQLNDKEINGLHLKDSPYFNIFFDNFREKEYLNLMLIKRQLFHYEGEIRYMLMGNFDFSSPLDIEIPWAMCLKKISFNERETSDEDEEIIRKALKTNYSFCKKKYSLTYEPYIPIEPENIYKSFSQITVGKTTKNEINL